MHSIEELSAEWHVRLVGMDGKRNEEENQTICLIVQITVTVSIEELPYLNHSLIILKYKQWKGILSKAKLGHKSVRPLIVLTIRCPDNVLMFRFRFRCGLRLWIRSTWLNRNWMWFLGNAKWSFDTGTLSIMNLAIATRAKSSPTATSDQATIMRTYLCGSSPGC